MDWKQAADCLLTLKEIFKTQLRALFRASVSGKLSIMYPMITSVEEVMQIKEIVEEVMQELDDEKIPYKIPEQGIMIETPAAVMISDELAPSMVLKLRKEIRSLDI